MATKSDGEFSSVALTNSVADQIKAIRREISRETNRPRDDIVRVYQWTVARWYIKPKESK
jgi:hypothetical protein